MQKNNKKPTSFSLSEDTLQMLKMLAEKDSRKPTNFLELVIHDLFKKSGLVLPKKK